MTRICPKEDKGNLIATCRSKYLPDSKRPRGKQKFITIPWIIDNSQNVSGTTDFQSRVHSGLHCIQWQKNPDLPTTRNLNSGVAHTHIDTIPGEICPCLLKKAKKDIMLV